MCEIVTEMDAGILVGIRVGCRNEEKTWGE